MKKLYVVGGSIGYANWILPLGYKVTYDIDEAELLLFTGGADLDPKLYNEPEGKFTYSDKNRSKVEMEYFNFAVKNKIKMFGTCLGCQTIGVLGIPNAKLIQHISHPYQHDIILPYNGNKKITVPSCHHQMLFVPEEQEGKDYLRIGYAEKLSKFHLDGHNQDYNFPDNYKEIEGIYIPNIQALAFQTHFEFLDLDHPSISVAQQIFSHYIL